MIVGTLTCISAINYFGPAFFYPESPTLGRLNQLAEAVGDNLDRVDETWTFDQIEALADKPPWGKICEIRLEWLDPGSDVLRGVFTTRLECIGNGQSLYGEVFVVRRDVAGELVGWRWDLDFTKDDPIAEIEWEPTDKSWPKWYPLHDVPSP